jgi:lipopolysaccharide export LptBFGC system permease protein LptF
MLLPQATANLATTIIGAGIMALPRAFATLGLVLGATMLGLIFILSFFSLGSLVRCAAVSPQRCCLLLSSLSLCVAVVCCCCVLPFVAFKCHHAHTNVF